ncbi:LysR substrate-binding domain-containing protein [Mesorhizobium sp. dw_380]|uniref:LysR substrate-binding domain-containing protein n=1 Tax=Mesorhizobium sp. dw_380 TaxID=2812001 RepID=UPI00203228E2|nr:LysR substrate-binding domain-containing protein [Mesorhizobium sp. dw_380]
MILSEYEMELRHLRYFLAVAEFGHVTRAAQHLHISQPPLSRAIRELEAELGVELFVRERQRIALTPAGSTIAEEARAVVAKADGLMRYARAISAGEGGRIRVGYVDGAMQGGVLSAHLRNLRTHCPGLVVDLVAASTETQLKALANNQLDIAIIYAPREWPEDIVSFKLLSDGMRLVVSTEDVLASRRTIAPKDLEASPWIALPREGDAYWRDRFLQQCATAGFRPDIRYEVAQLSALLGLVEAGAGRGLAQASVSRVESPGVVLRSLPWWRHTVDYWLAWRQHNAMPSVRQFLKANGLATNPKLPSK